MRGSNCDGAQTILTRFELVTGSVRRHGHAHKLTTVTCILLLEFLATTALPLQSRDLLAPLPPMM